MCIHMTTTKWLKTYSHRTKWEKTTSGYKGNANTHSNVDTHSVMLAYTQTRARAHAHSFTHSLSYIHTHTHTHTCMNTHTHTLISPTPVRSRVRTEYTRLTRGLPWFSSQILCYLVSWCFEPSQPQRITSGLNTNFTLSPSYSFHKSFYHKTCFEPVSIPRALNTGTRILQGDLFYSAGLHRNRVHSYTGEIERALERTQVNGPEG